MTGRSSSVGGVRGPARAVGVDGREGVQGAVVALDPVQEQLHQLPAGGVPGPHRRGEGSGGVER